MKLDATIRFPGKLIVLQSFLFIVLTLMGSEGCASRLPREKKLRTDTNATAAEKIDLTSIRFIDLATNQPVTISDFMQKAELDHVLLTFGSKNCAACNRKAKALVKDVIGRHPLYLSDAGRRFSIIGINTDPAPERLGGYLKEFPFIRWSDPSGVVMVSRLAPSGSRFRVPLTVMLRRDGILWRILPDDKISVDGMMLKVEQTLGLSPTETGTGGMNEPSEPSGDSADPAGQGAPPNLGLKVANRLDSVQVTSCDGTQKSLTSFLSDASWRFVQVTRGNCVEGCLDTAQNLQNIGKACREAGLGACAGLTLEHADAPVSAQELNCKQRNVYVGGGEILKVFASHFDWNYPKKVDDQGLPYLVRAVSGPQTLGFQADGTLMYSHEGVVATQELLRAIQDRDPAKHARGPDFALFDEPRGIFSFADWRLQSKYTVVMGWSTVCNSCDAQLKHWSKSGQLIDFCAAHPADCQVGAVENTFPGSREALRGYFDGLLSGTFEAPTGVTYDGFQKLGIRVPLLLDPVADIPGDTDYLNRLHDGYMLAASRDIPSEHQNDFRTFIYDQEGKVVARFYGEVLRDGEDDPVLVTIKQLLKNTSRR
jgi:hypothetical protein